MEVNRSQPKKINAGISVSEVGRRMLVSKAAEKKAF